LADAHDTLRALAHNHGFTVVGVTSGAVLEEALVHLTAWCEANRHASMAWMARNPSERADPRTLLDGVRSIVALAVAHGPAPAAFDPAGRYGRVARYAWGRDYHDIVLGRLDGLAKALAATFGASRTRCACDVSPLLERAAAARAGLGFAGKNTCLILPRQGSYAFLGEILLDVEVPPAPTERLPHCGSCRRCLDACPTRAFPAAHVLDARRCVSYLTIEHRGVIPLDLRK